MLDPHIADQQSIAKLPMWGVAKSAVTAAETAGPSATDHGIDTEGWKSIWVDVHFKTGGTQTATIKVWFWSPGGTPNGVNLAGGWFASGLSDITVAGGDGGHKATRLETYGRKVYFQVSVLGAGAEAHVLVAGAERH